MLGDPPVSPLVVVGYAAVVGVGIDIDHFLVARYNAGDWAALRRCLRRPRIVLLDQGAIFETLDVNPVERLLSHVVIAGLLVGGLWLVSPYFAWVTGAVLYVHLLADLLADTLEFPETARQYVRALEAAEASSESSAE